MSEHKPAKKRFDILNAKTKKPIVLELKEHYGYTKKFDYALILTAKEKLYAVNQEVFDLPVEKLKINSFGMYFGEFKDGKLRLSIEGSQLVGPDCTLNVIELSFEQTKQWMNGEDLERTSSMECSGYVILRCGEDYLGCGRMGPEKITCFVPKNRRVRIT